MASWTIWSAHFLLILTVWSGTFARPMRSKVLLRRPSFFSSHRSSRRTCSFRSAAWSIGRCASDHSSNALIAVKPQTALITFCRPW
ncbi:hypothetical protein HDK64DRAFT_261954 [Phyllosticta capitalensis]